MSKRKEIVEKIGEISVSDFSGEFSEIIEILKENSDYYGSKFPNAKSIFVQFEIDDHEDSYSIYEQFVVYQKRLETDKEYKKRINKNNENKSNQKNREYETYLKLKKKYEKSTK